MTSLLRISPRLTGWLGVLLLGGLLAGPAAAQERPKFGPPGTPTPAAPARPAVPPSGTRVAANKVALQVLVVHATDSANGVDPRIASLANSFRYFKYKGYNLLSTQNAEVAVNDTANFSIVGGRRVKVTLISMDDARARLHVEISNNEGKLFDTTVSINRGGTFIITGPKYQDGILMLPVRANY